MDLWIRSQDKKWLTRCDCVQYTTSTVDMEDASLKTIDGHFLEDKGLLLGKYRTQERALEVLDEIQKIVNEKPIILVNSRINDKEIKKYGDCFVFADNSQNFIPATSVVYQMPKE